MIFNKIILNQLSLNLMSLVFFFYVDWENKVVA
jgi:hypothetical protein